ncbi:class I SAM-dependent methyltransferase [Roseibium aggregatum]|uniref:Methyltransferase domain-containing protein n=1 Tax=Roseibium aggregatum TaxID=187304 RepID=A0A926S7U6_9HYPH|nr:class I SAM-dependent methyltransferase [Roseibium aggregatum]MBD1548695.1 methyltransferase domain-containing protein [Roseibium aggregatum]
MTDNASFWDKVATRYARSPVRNEAAYAETLARTRAYLKPSDRVLEIGCGTGTTALKLAGSVESLLATDVSGKMIGIATAKLADGAAGNVSFRQAEIGADTFDGGSFDAVLAFNLLHLIGDTAGAVRSVRDQLKPGGLFISKTVCLSEAGPLLRPLFRLLIPVMRFFGKAPFVRFLKISELETLIGVEGFEIVETGNYPAKPPSRFIVARKV